MEKAYSPIKNINVHLHIRGKNHLNLWECTCNKYLDQEKVRRAGRGENYQLNTEVRHFRNNDETEKNTEKEKGLQCQHAIVYIFY